MDIELYSLMSSLRAHEFRIRKRKEEWQGLQIKLSINDKEELKEENSPRGQSQD